MKQTPVRDYREVSGNILKVEDTKHSTRVTIQAKNEKQTLICHKWQREALNRIVGCWMPEVVFRFVVDQYDYISAISVEKGSFHELPKLDRQAGIRRKKWLS